MNRFIKGISCLFIAMLMLALLGKYLPFNTTTPFFKWYTPYVIQVAYELVLLICSIGAIWIVSKKRENKRSISSIFGNDFKKQKRLFLSLYFLINISVVLVFYAHPGWDYATAIYESGSLLRNGSIGLREYVMQYPNNLLYIVTVMPIVYIFGSDNAVNVTVFINILILVYTLSLFLDVVYKLTRNTKRVAVAAVGFILFFPLIYYNQTFYTDTIVLPFILGGILLLFEASGDLTLSKKKYFQALCLFLIAALFKASILVIFAALSIVSFICYKKWRKIYALSVVVGIAGVKIGMICFISIWSFFYPPLYNKSISEVGFPESAWICMAQNDETRGDYNARDVKRVQDLYRNANESKEAVDQRMKSCIKERILSRNLIENGHFFFRKFAFSWSDPSYYAVYNLGLISSPLGEKMQYADASKLEGNGSMTRNNLFLEQGYLAVVHYGYLDIFQNVIYLLVIVITAQRLKKKKNINHLQQFIILTTLGYGAFHLLWEARSRYVMTVMILLILYVCIYYQEKNSEQKNTKN